MPEPKSHPTGHLQPPNHARCLHTLRAYIDLVLEQGRKVAATRQKTTLADQNVLAEALRDLRRAEILDLTEHLLAVMDDFEEIAEVEGEGTLTSGPNGLWIEGFNDQ